MPLGQCLAHMAPERRRRIRDPGDELLVGAGDVLPKVKAGNVRAPALPACIGDVTKDAGVLAQPVPPALERLGRRMELAAGDVVEGGEGLVQMLVDRARS